MAASSYNSVNLTAPSSKYPYVLSASFTENSTNIENNTSNVTVSGSVVAQYVNFSSSYDTIQIDIYWFDNHNNINGVLTNSVTAKKSERNVPIGASATFDVPHKPDGTLQGYAKVYLTKLRTNGYAPNNGEVSTEPKDLTTVPRATAPVNIIGTIETSTNININPASQSFNHSIQLYFGNTVKFLDSNGNLSDNEVRLYGTSFNFNVPVEYYSQFTGTHGSGVVCFRTYNENTYIGETWSTLEVYASASICKPSISGTVKDINPITLALTNDENSLINNRSIARITPNIRVSSINDGYAYLEVKTIVNSRNETINILNDNHYDDYNSNRSGYVIYTKNSRGGEETATLNITGRFVPYKDITIENNGLRSALFDRVTETGDKIQAGFKGNFYSGFFDLVNELNKNTLSLSWYVRKNENDDWTFGGTFEEETDYTIDETNNTYYSNGEILLTCPFEEENWNYKQKYYFKMVATDLLNPIEKPIVYSQYLKVGLPVINWYEKNDTNYFNVNGVLLQNNKKIIGIDLLYNRENTYFSSGTLGIDISSYDFVLIVTTIGSKLMPVDICYGDFSTSGWYSGASADRASVRRFWRDGNDIYFDVCYGRGINGHNGYSEENDYILPMRVYGIKIQ